MTIRAHCNTCQTDTNQALLFEDRSVWEQDEDDLYLSGWDNYELLKCLGCDTVCIRHRAFTEGFDETPRVQYYPPALARAKPQWLRNFTPLFPFPTEYTTRRTIEDYLEEIYSALQNGSLRLAALGIRSLLETIMIAEVGDSGTFKSNIAGFQKAGHITEKVAEFLKTAIDAGHASTHRGWKPERGDIETLLNVAESIIHSIYVIHAKVDELKPRIPPANKKR